MSGNGYLFAAYAATWIIHIIYLGTIVSRYSRLKREIEDLKKPAVRSYVAGVRSKAHAADFIAKFFLTPETWHLRPYSLQPFLPHSASHYAADAVCAA